MLRFIFTNTTLSSATCTTHDTTQSRIPMVLLTVILLLWIHGSLAQERVSPWLHHSEVPPLLQSELSLGRDPVTWWQGALSACRNGSTQGVLACCHDDVTLQDSLLFPVDGEEVWMGLMKASTQWRWEDGTPLYEFKGHYHGDLFDRSFYFLDNELFLCSIRCRTPYLALQGRWCTCLNRSPGSLVVTSERQEWCPGSDEVLCGNATGYSLYQQRDLEDVGWQLDVKESEIFNAEFAAMEQDSTRLEVSIRLAPTTRPLGLRFTFCSSEFNGTYVLDKSSRRTVGGAYVFCKAQGMQLGRLTRSNIRAVASNLRQGASSDTYWIGLSRLVSWRNLDGSTVEVDAEEDSDTSSGRQCLSLRQLQGSSFFMSRDCTNVFRPLCLHRVPLSGTTGAPPDVTRQPEVQTKGVPVSAQPGSLSTASSGGGDPGIRLLSNVTTADNTTAEENVETKGRRRDDDDDDDDDDSRRARTTSTTTTTTTTTTMITTTAAPTSLTSALMTSRTAMFSTTVQMTTTTTSADNVMVTSDEADGMTGDRSGLEGDDSDTTNAAGLVVAGVVVGLVTSVLVFVALYWVLLRPKLNLSAKSATADRGVSNHYDSADTHYYNYSSPRQVPPARPPLPLGCPSEPPQYDSLDPRTRDKMAETDETYRDLELYEIPMQPQESSKRGRKY